MSAAPNSCAAFSTGRADPLKQWKLSRIDVDGLKRWEAYSDAIAETLALGHTARAPWTVIRADDKRRARLAVIRAILAPVDYDGKDRDVVGRPGPGHLRRTRDVGGSLGARRLSPCRSAGITTETSSRRWSTRRLRLIEEKGPTGFTLSEAAKNAGVTPAAVYRHFEGREDLIAECARQGQRDLSRS